MNQALVLFSLIGTTLIVVHGSIFQSIRNLAPSFLGCSQCVGFWIGVWPGAIGILSVGHGKALDMFVGGTATSFLALLANAVLLNLLGGPKD